MTAFSKVLALLSTAGCFAFLGFVLVTMLAGPNWPGEAGKIDDYAFTRSSGEEPKWSAAYREEPKTPIGTSKVLPKTIVEVQKQILDRQEKELKDLEIQIASREDYLNNPRTGLLAMVHQDIKALSQKERQLEKDLLATSNALIQKTKEITQLGRETEIIKVQAEYRRNDIYRLRNLVAEAETDRYRSIEHQEKLRDVYERYQGVINRLKQRNAQLKQLKQQQQSGNSSVEL